ncbi:MAG: spinster family MFS transporter [Porticoccaceae bacterium]|jgi:predicted MFS family arabinose efflux permease
MKALQKTEPEQAEPFFGGHKSYVLFICFLVYTFNYVDRQILIILAEPIKNEFGLSDSHLGFLTGTAFALFYATLGIPIAHLADRLNRVNIIAISLAIWSAMTALCAFTTNFAQLAAARIGVGIGEAGGSPPSSSLLSSYFPVKQRSTAMGIYALGPTVGLLLGFIVGGWVNEFYGWRVAMLVVGLPGLLLAIVLKLTVREPQRENITTPASNQNVTSFKETVKTLFAIRSFRWVNAGATITGFSVYGFMVWTPIHLIRQFGLSTGEVGTAIGLVAGIAGSIGIFGGGFLADALSKRNIRWQMRIPAITTLIFFPLILVFLNASSPTMAIILLIPAYTVALAYTGPTWAALQSVSPPHMRAMAAAIMLFLVNLIGLGFGPQLIGIMSDVLGKTMGSGALTYAIGLSGTLTLLASLCYFLASRSLPEDIQE